ncbi:MAG: trypsin-like peptidase domain-containing protein [Betaproteobacteria bacterium]|nr:trypsin-like peptidase domain-containing protein [Betaproteobacteria bacterium]
MNAPRFTILDVALFSGLLLLGSGYAMSAERSELKRIHAEMLAPVVQLEHNCSGSVIHSAPDNMGRVETFILTAKHCVADVGAHQLTVNIPGFDADSRLVREIAYKATVIARYDAHDLALLKLADTETVLTDVVSLAPADLKMQRGEDTWAVGYPVGLVQTLTVGIFTSRNTIPWGPEGVTRDFEYFRATADVAPGNSGGALFRQADDGRYEQIGVLTGTAKAGNHLALWVPIDVVHEFLARAVPQVGRPAVTVASR